MPLGDNNIIINLLWKINNGSNNLYKKERFPHYDKVAPCDLFEKVVLWKRYYAEPSFRVMGDF